MPRIYALAGVLVVLMALLVWVLRIDHLRGEYKSQFEALTEQSAEVVLALREASDNPTLGWREATGQIVALGESNRTLRVSIEVQNRNIEDMARDAVRLEAEASELRDIAERAEAQRRSALARLSNMAATPGTRSDCMVLLGEAEAALDLVREAGL